MYLNLLFKALKGDENIERVKAFVRRFVQVLVAGVGGSGGAEFIAGGLYLLGELFQATPALRELLGDGKGKRRAPTQGGEETEYDPKKREPQFANASASPMYELVSVYFFVDRCTLIAAFASYLCYTTTTRPFLSMPNSFSAMRP